MASSQGQNIQLLGVALCVASGPAFLFVDSNMVGVVVLLLGLAVFGVGRMRAAL